MSDKRKEHRDRLVVLAFVSVLMVLIYGPLAPWFIAADRFFYDLFASNVQTSPPENAVIVSIDPARKSKDELLALLVTSADGKLPSRTAHVCRRQER